MTLRLEEVGLEPVRPVVQPGARMTRLRDSHHGLARVLASGASRSEASAITGYSPARIGILEADPAFAELLAFYRLNVNEKYFDMHERMAALGADMTQELHERLNDSPESFDNRFLLEGLKVLADRTGYAPIAKSVNVNVNADLASRLASARERAGLAEPEAAPT